ncbi:MAG: IPT/TIG domain-containing protein [Methanomicrobiales archaeon]|nr:IPT/TIG domain-containing protein [Methanomicrobiales archaeon]
MTIANRPSGSGPLQVGFTFTGDGSLQQIDSQSVIVTDAAGASLFEYTGLSAFSADGRQLPASLATDGTTLYWSVDDAGAAYPVTIDPVIVPAAGAKAKFTGGAPGDWFGFSVALSDDGATALVGANWDDNVGGIDAGAAYIFERPPGGWVSMGAAGATAIFTGQAPGDHFGFSVALSGDGQTALVGAGYGLDYSAESAYIFVKGGAWASKSAAGADAKFTREVETDGFGWSVALSDDGATALVGAKYESTAAVDAGAAYIFVRPGGGWNTYVGGWTAKFTGEALADWFGCSVALSSDGNTALVGAWGNDAGGYVAGAAYIFEKGVAWTSKGAAAATAKFTGEAPLDQFGNSVALSGDGATALVGDVRNKAVGVDSGAAYIFERPPGGWVNVSASGADTKFTGEAPSDFFGLSVALSDDGTTTFVGAYMNDNVGGVNAGAAYIFQAPYTTPTFISILPTSGPISGGTAVTITGGNLFGATVVTFDGIAATGFTVVSGTSITATTPAHAAGAVDVVITTPNGTTTQGVGAYTYTTGGGGGGGDGPGPKDPGISGISPGSGTSGSIVTTTIIGTNFPTTTKKSAMNRGFMEGYETRSVSYQDGAGTTTIKVWLSQLGESNIIGKEVNVLSSTKLTCLFNLMGAHPGKWTVNAKRSDGFITAVLTDAFTVKPASAVPTIHHINPTSVKAGGKAFVIIVTGENFAKGNRVQWKGVARETTFVSATTLKAKVLATDIAKAGRYVVSVYRPGKDAATSNGVAFTVRK